MWHARTAGSYGRIGLTALACFLATAADGQTADPHQLLAEADRIAWLRVWTRAEPLYAQARKGFAARGDRRNALYAEVCQLRGKLPTLAVPEVSERLAAYLDDPLAQGDERLRLRILIIKGETDEDLDPSLSQRSWTEALALADKLGDAGWANRARAELGLVAFLQGDTNTAIVNLGQAIKVAETTRDTSSLVRWLTLFGHGYVELGRPEQALDFYDRALRIASTVRELQLPVMTYLGKADALVKLGRVNEAEVLIEDALEAAKTNGSLGYQAELTLRLALIAQGRKQTARALQAMARASELARAAGGNRILAGIALERARGLRAANLTSQADTALREGVRASRKMGERLMLPRLLAQLADVQLSMGRRTQAVELLREADDLLEGLLTNASSPWVRGRILASMDEVISARIRLEGERATSDATGLFAAVERARGRSLLDLLYARPLSEIRKPSDLSAGERRIAALQLKLLRTTAMNERQRLLMAVEHLDSWTRTLSRTRSPRRSWRCSGLVPAHELPHAWRLRSGRHLAASARRGYLRRRHRRRAVSTTWTLRSFPRCRSRLRKRGSLATSSATVSRLYWSTPLRPNLRSSHSR
jgi:tetratricopeptide (TPR) repeat protein